MSSSNLVKTYTDIKFDATTDNGGDIDLPIKTSGVKVIYAYSNANYFILLRFVNARGCWGVKVLQNDESGSLIPVKTAAVTIYYAISPECKF